MEAKINQVIFVSATPSEYEMQKCEGEVVEQVIRPTGLLDPVIEVVPARGQVMHLLEQIRQRLLWRPCLVTALTKRLAEDLATFLSDNDVKCRWLHSELDAFERVALLQDLREGRCDVIVGVNLLREGLDLPEVFHGRHSRCRQRGLFAQRNVASANHWSSGSKREFESHSVR